MTVSLLVRRSSLIARNCYLSTRYYCAMAEAPSPKKAKYDIEGSETVRESQVDGHTTRGEETPSDKPSDQGQEQAIVCIYNNYIYKCNEVRVW